jgi:hypothetical protein
MLSNLTAGRAGRSRSFDELDLGRTAVKNGSSGL